jgi:glutamine amidotransferase
MIGVLDYGVGNVGAFLRIFHSQNIEAIRIKESNDFCNIEKIVLPGVGAFDSAMDKLNRSGLRSGLDDFVLGQGKPLLGVCIGMHMLGLTSDEGIAEGLGYIKGHTTYMKADDLCNPNILLPHMGWNDVSTLGDSSIWDDVDLEQGFYFLHSYTFKATDPKSVIGVSTYHNEITCAVRSDNIYGFQFHPEKSLGNGVQLLINFATKA